MIDYKFAAQLACNDVYRASEMGEAIVVDNDAVLIKRQDGVLYIATAGTNDYEDWVENFDISNDGGVCRGFMRPAQKIMEKIDELGVIDPTQEMIVFCGHSRGGSIAMVLATLFTGVHQLMVAVTFGAPRPFLSRKLRNFMKPACFCFEHVRDPVPHLFPGARRNREQIQTGKWWNFADLNWWELLTPWRFVMHYFKSGHSRVGYELAARKYQKKMDKAERGRL